MRSFTDVLSLSSRFVLLLCFILTCYLLFCPSWGELLLLILVGVAANAFLSFLSRSRLFLIFFPSSQPYFPIVQRQVIKDMNTAERQQLLSSLIQFPYARAIYCTLLNAFIIIPLAVVIAGGWSFSVFGWQRISISLLICLIFLIAFYGILFVELHQYVSLAIAKFHREDDWSALFSIPPSMGGLFSFGNQERVVLGLIWVLILLSQWILLSEVNSGFPISWQVASISLTGLILVSRFLYVSQAYFMGGLSSLVLRLENFVPDKFQGLVPYHSTNVLSQFEWVLNSLIFRLREYRKQVSHWVLVRAEQTRITALGEISALVVHDLGTPLHVISFCAMQIKERAREVPDPRYLDQLMENVVRSVELVESLRTYLRNGEGNQKGCVFIDAFYHAERVLRSQIGDKNFSKVKRIIDSEIKGSVRVRMAQADLVHVLHNLLANAYEILLKSNVEEAKFSVNLAEMDNRHVTLLISDNGSGLSQEKFDQLTSDEYREEKDLAPRTGLGLRLIRALVERYGGELSLVRGASNKGTTFRLKLPFVEVFLA